jgi:hypothetical protein
MKIKLKKTIRKSIEIVVYTTSDEIKRFLNKNYLELFFDKSAYLTI